MRRAILDGEVVIGDGASVGVGRDAGPGRAHRHASGITVVDLGVSVS